ncbi:MAG: PKD domain-containing protein, partial [Bacteroidetes bacterium]|nr:PKD domain-containing protein [Bacteroidota bacterium]
DISLYNYQWNFGNGQTSTAVQPGTITFLSNPTFSDTVYHIKLKILSVCDTLIVEKTVHVKSKPKALFTPAITSGCSPMNVVFKNTSKGIGNTYYWDFGDGHTDVTNNLQSVQHTFYTSKVDTFYVRLIAVNECGNDTLRYAIIVAPNSIKLNFAMNGPDHYGCIPHTVAFINNSSGASSFQWDFGDGNILSTYKNIDTVYHTYYAAGNYTILLRAQNNCADTSTTDQLTVFPKPTAAFAVQSNRVCKGDTLFFKNNSTLATSYQWKFGDGTTSVLENPKHVYTSPGLYTVKLFVFKLNAPGSTCIDSTEQQIEVVSSLPGTFTMSGSSSECAPFTVTFVNKNKPSVTALWDFGDGSNASGDSVIHTYNFSGTYTVNLTVTVPGGCTYNTSNTVTVKGPSGKLNYSGGGYCYPDNVRFEAIANNTNTYHWDFGDGNTLITTQAIVYHIYTNPGNYIPTLSLQNTAGCNYFIKGIDTIKIDRLDAGYTISQQRNCGTTIVKFSDTSHAYSGKSLVKWDFGDGNTSTGMNVVHTYTTSGIYQVQMIVISNSGCMDTVRKQFDFHVNNRPIIGISADISACAKLPVIFTGNIQSIDSLNILQWDISNGAKGTGTSLNYTFAQPGTYNVRFIAGTVNGCYDTAYHTILIKASPTVKASADVILCKGNSTQLNASGALQYQWSPLQGLSCNTCANPIAAPDISTPYVVTGFNNLGCPGFDTVNITVIQPLKLNSSGNDSICIGQSANLLVSGAASYIWNPSTALSSTTIANPVANPKITTTYRVIGYDGYHCFTDTAFIVVAVGQYPTINLGPDQVLATGTLFPLHSVVTNGPVRNWNWTPTTNLDCASCALPIAHIKKDITYAVEITTAYGCKASDTINIKVFCKNAQVFIPNAFTPDGDGVNDILMVRATGIASVKSFRIFNRWGELVFEKNNFQPNEPSFGWDGKIRGKPGPPDVYVYTAEVICENGVSFVYKGNTTILK